MNRDPRSAQTTLGLLGLVLALLGAFALLPRVFAPRDAESVGSAAPDFDLPVAANASALGPAKAGAKTLKLSGLKGNAVLLDFWATWCEPCRVEAPIVDQVGRRMRDQGLVTVGVNVDSPDQGDPHAFALAHGLTYPIVHDADGTTLRRFAVESLPTIVIVGRDGKVSAVRRGATTADELEQLVRKVL